MCLLRSRNTNEELRTEVGGPGKARGGGGPVHSARTTPRGTLQQPQRPPPARSFSDPPFHRQPLSPTSSLLDGDQAALLPHG